MIQTTLTFLYKGRTKMECLKIQDVLLECFAGNDLNLDFKTLVEELELQSPETYLEITSQYRWTAALRLRRGTRSKQQNERLPSILNKEQKSF